MEKKPRPKMTPLERKSAIEYNKKIDRLPILISYDLIGAKMAGMTYLESEQTSENIAYRDINAYRILGFDKIKINYSITGLAYAYGGKFKFEENSPPHIINYPMKNLEEHYYLDLDSANLNNDSRLQKLFKATELIIEDVGDEVEVLFNTAGPMTLAASLISPETLLRGIIKKPDVVHSLLEFVTNTIIKTVIDFSKLNVGYAFSDPVASPDLISPNQYQTFCLPYTKKIVEIIHSLGKECSIHICGDTSKILDLIADTGSDWFSLDQKVDIREAARAVGSRMGLSGNVDPTDIFLNGSVKEMYKDVEKCIKKGSYCDKGFQLNSGCSVLYNTPIENMYAYMNAGERYSHFLENYNYLN